MPDDRAWAVLERLIGWLDQFKGCFGHRAQHVSLQHYIEGLLSDSPRKSMQAMLTRVTASRSYQAFHHFITDAPWSHAAVWRRLWAVIPDRRGVLILDDTPFLKQGTQSVGVAKQYAGARFKITNCQIAVTAALWTGLRGWLVGAELYLPPDWLSPERRQRARIPSTVRFQEKWRLALTLVRRVRAAGITIDAVLADAGYGEVAALRRALEWQGLRYVLGIQSDATVFRGTPRSRPPRRWRRAGAPERKRQLAGAPRIWRVAPLIAQQPPTAWTRVAWRNGRNRRWCADFLALRVTPVVEWRRGRRLMPVWLLAERVPGATTPHRYYFSNLPLSASVQTLARLIHQRWAIEQQYQDLKSHLGLDHFEGRTYPGWHHHVVLSAVAYAFLQTERRRQHRGPQLTFPQVHAIIQEVFTGLLFITHDRYWNWLQKGRQYAQLRI